MYVILEQVPIYDINVRLRYMNQPLFHCATIAKFVHLKCKYLYLVRYQSLLANESLSDDSNLILDSSVNSIINAKKLRIQDSGLCDTYKLIYIR